MGVPESYTELRESLPRPPGQIVLAFFLFGLMLDLLLKLAGIEIGMLGGDLATASMSRRFWDGIVNGLLFGLAGIGLSMTYSILVFANFSHGDLLTWGAFTGWGVAYLIAAGGEVAWEVLVLVRPGLASTPAEVGAALALSPVGLFAGLIVAFGMTAVMALVIDRVIYRPMRDRSGIALLIASIGVALVLRYMILFVYTGSRRGVLARVRLEEPALQLFGYTVITNSGDVNFFGLTVLDSHNVALVISAVTLMLGLHILLQYTKLGTAMRAMADNKDLALVTGIPTERVVFYTWVIGGGLAGAAGFLTVMSRGTIAFDFGWQLLLFIFAAVILGGIGSIYGAMAGGLLIGLVFSLSTIWIPGDFREAAAFAVMIIALLYRPEGLFGGITSA